MRSRSVRDDGLARVDARTRAYDADDAFITWTSGTTGRPKPIVHTHSGYTELLDRMLGPLRARLDPAPTRVAPDDDRHRT